MGNFKASKMRFDLSKNALMVDVGDMGSTCIEVEIPFSLLKDALPAEMTEEEQIKELQRIIHNIEKEKLLNIQEFVKEVKRLSAGIEGARTKLAKASSKNEITKYRHVVQSWLSQKNIIKELRLIIKTLNDEKKALRTRIAKLEVGA